MRVIFYRPHVELVKYRKKKTELPSNAVMGFITAERSKMHFNEKIVI